MTAKSQQQGAGKPAKGKWALARRVATIAFFILVPVLLFFLIKNVDWQEVATALQKLQPHKLALGLAIAVASYLLFSSFDLFSRYYVGHTLPIRQVWPLAFVCCVFNLNLGASVGGIALRFRLYSRLGLDAPTVTKILTFNFLTNWMGYLFLAGIIFSSRLLQLPQTWKIGTTGLQVIGVFFLGLFSAYLLACQFSKKRSWRLFGQEIDLPGIKLALCQTVLSAANWSLMALLIFCLLPGDIFYPTILGTLLLSSLAGMIMRVPGGIGVLEAVFVTLLQHQLGKGTILAALIGYRCIYFLLPLAIATVMYLVIESRAKKMRAENNTDNHKNSNVAQTG